MDIAHQITYGPSSSNKRVTYIHLVVLFLSRLVTQSHRHTCTCHETCHLDCFKGAPTAGVFTNKHVLNDKPSRLDLVGTSFESSVHAACGTILVHRFQSGYNSSRLGRRTVQFASWASPTSLGDVWLAAPTSLSDVWLAARCLHPLHARKICAAWNLDCYRLLCCVW